jgi:hypothetical protein
MEKLKVSTIFLVKVFFNLLSLFSIIVFICFSYFFSESKVEEIFYIIAYPFIAGLLQVLLSLYFFTYLKGIVYKAIGIVFIFNSILFHIFIVALSFSRPEYALLFNLIEWILTIGLISYLFYKTYPIEFPAKLILYLFSLSIFSAYVLRILIER